MFNHNANQTVSTDLHPQSESGCRRRFVLRRGQRAALLPLLMQGWTSCSQLSWSSTRLVHLHTETQERAVKRDANNHTDQKV